MIVLIDRYVTEKGKPREIGGRKAMGLKFACRVKHDSRVAEVFNLLF